MLAKTLFFKHYFFKYFVFIAVIIIYCHFSKKFGAFTFAFHHAITELPLLVYLFHFLSMHLKKGLLSQIIAALPIFMLYIIHDYFFIGLGRLPQFSDALLFPIFFHILPLYLIILALSVIIIPLILYISSLSFPIKIGKLFISTAPFFLIFVAVYQFPEKTLQVIHTITQFKLRSHEQNIHNYGRVFMLLIREAENKKIRNIFSHPYPIEKSELFLSENLLKTINKRNVHIIILESFIDPNLLKNIQFNQNPIHPKLTDFFKDNIGISLSPAFAGGTARSEFEVLCGVPALSSIYGIEEFNAFTGSSAYCLPNILRSSGYYTLSTFPHTPEMYNARLAYKGLGFQLSLFGDKYVSSHQDSVKLGKLEANEFLFDGDLYQQIIAKIKPHIQNNQPIFNYILTIYGHTPCVLNEKKHPKVITTTPENEIITCIANQTRYRSEALVQYIHSLIEIDPESLIIAVSDHLPPLPLGKNNYEQFGYQGRILRKDPLSLHENFLLFVDHGKPEKIGPIRHFEIYSIILDKLTDGAYCKQKHCTKSITFDKDKYLEKYFTIMGTAAKPLPSN